MSSPLLALTTCPDAASAKAIATTLLEERLAAGVNQVDGVLSRYHWRNDIQKSNELLLLIQTTRDQYQRLEQRINELHPYEVPKIIAFDIAAGLPSYLDWIRDSCA